MIALWVSPPNHGKSLCDVHGCTVKGMSKRYLVTPERHIDNSTELTEFIVDKITIAWLKKSSSQKKTK